jgi:RimJ/RimL family protein N-acetyltransferase
MGGALVPDIMAEPAPAHILQPHSLQSARLAMTYVPNLKLAHTEPGTSSGAFHLDLEGCHVGTVSLVDQIAQRAVIGYTIAQDYRRRGIASEAVGAVLAAADAFGLTHIAAHCRSDNAASRGVLERNGFTLETSSPWSTNGRDNTLQYMVYQWIAARPT